MWDGNWGGMRNEMRKNGDWLWDRKEWERYGRGYIERFKKEYWMRIELWNG